MGLFTRCVLGFLCGFAGAASADLVGSAISVQGVLSADGVPAEGVYDLRLTPYPDAVGAAPSGPPQEVDNVLVVGGAFTTRVDFGLSLFQGERVFVEIAVRAGNSTGSYEALLPRQELTPAPYALKPAPGSVGSLEIVSGSVGPAQLLDGGVQTGELADGAVSALKLADGAVTAPKLAAGAVGSAAIADGGVAGADLATGSVGAAQIADGAVGSAELADGGVTLAKLATDSVDGGKVVDGSIGAADLAPGAIPPSGWTLNGNAPTAAQFLGTTNGAPLALRTDVGVTVNGDRFNNSTELTLRGSPAAADTNADLGLWPRGSTAFFNIAAIGADPSTASLQVASIGTTPFTGYVARLILAYGGALGVGTASPVPQATLHAIRSGLGIDASELSEAFEILAEDGDAQVGLLSNSSGGAGSSLLLGEVVGGAYANGWSLWRATSGVSNTPLHFAYGTSSSAPSNPSRMTLFSDGSLFAGAAVPAATLGTSFVFSDDSAVGALSPSGADQFLVRASGGVGINRTPAAASTELSIGPSTSGGSVDLVMGSPDGAEVNANLWLGTPAVERTWRMSTAGSPGGTVSLSIFNRNSATNDTPILQLFASGSSFTRQLALFRGLPNGSFLLPSHPIHVGDSSISGSGNGAHLTSGGVWTNGSSRAFKHAFTAIDPAAVLDALLQLPLSRWRYRDEDTGIEHLGPMAEDFHAAFGLGGDPRYIGTVDADGVALAAIQGLNAKLERENADLRVVLQALSARLDALERGAGDD